MHVVAGRGAGLGPAAVAEPWLGAGLQPSGTRHLELLPGKPGCGADAKGTDEFWCLLWVDPCPLHDTEQAQPHPALVCLQLPEEHRPSVTGTHSVSYSFICHW